MASKEQLDRALGDFNYLVASFLASYTPLQINKCDLGGFNFFAITKHVFTCAKRHNRTDDERSNDIFDMVMIGLHRGNITQDQFSRTNVAGVQRIKQLACLYEIPIRSSAREMIQLQEDTLTFVRAVTCFPAIASSILYRKIGLAKNGAKSVLASEQLPDAMKHSGFFGLIPKGCYSYLKKAYLFAHAAYMVDFVKMIDPGDMRSLKALAAGPLNCSKDTIENEKLPYSDERRVGMLRAVGLTDPGVFKKIVDVCNNLCKVVGEPEITYVKKNHIKGNMICFFEDHKKNVAANEETKIWTGMLSDTSDHDYSTILLGVASVLHDPSTSVD
ncbi:hypothetical protein QVD17_10694 [Tagetes erecta]|uniref:Nucleoprotein n=1 Tax=Tagetes erecta TaxID=13708 RepID=A0AAD8L2Y9_TARER|nr:hypothetical protein QVD17_10694 [Tagetes erecta]